MQVVADRVSTFVYWWCLCYILIAKRYILLDTKSWFANISFSTEKILSYCLLVASVFHKLANINIIVFLYIMCHFSLPILGFSFFIFHVQEFEYDVPGYGFSAFILCIVCWTSICFALNLGNFHSQTLLSFWYSNHTSVTSQCLLLSLRSLRLC